VCFPQTDCEQCEDQEIVVQCVNVVCTLHHWVRTQRARLANDKLRQDRKTILDEIGFVWKDDASTSMSSGTSSMKSCTNMNQSMAIVRCHKQRTRTTNNDKSLRMWVANQRARHAKMTPDQKLLLDALDFACKADTVAIRSSTSTEVRDLAICSFHALDRSCFSFLTLLRLFCMTNVCQHRLHHHHPAFL
jgi:very-short-patch-repair endonuclease